jgi:hypothetical protein
MDAWTPGWIDCQMVRYTRTTRFAWAVSGEPGMDTRRPSPRWCAVLNPTSRRNSCRSPTRRGLSIEMYKPQRRSGVAATESPSFSLVRKRSASRGIRAHLEIDAAGDPQTPMQAAAPRSGFRGRGTAGGGAVPSSNPTGPRSYYAPSSLGCSGGRNKTLLSADVMSAGSDRPALPSAT